MIPITVQVASPGLEAILDIVYISPFYIVSMYRVKSRSGNTRITMSNGEMFTCLETVEEILNNVDSTASKSLNKAN